MYNKRRVEFVRMRGPHVSQRSDFDEIEGEGKILRYGNRHVLFSLDTFVE